MRQLAVWTMGLTLALFGAVPHAWAQDATTKTDPGPSESTSLTLAVDDACKAMASAAREVSFSAPPCIAAVPLEGDEAVTACRGALGDALVAAVSKRLETEASLQTANLVTRWERQGRAFEALQVVSRLGNDLDRVVAEAVDELETDAEERLAKLDLTITKGGADAKTAWGELVESAAKEVSNRCRGELVEDVFTALAIRSLGESAAAAHEADLTKEDGFSRIVRCQWLRTPGQADRLECKPGIRLSGQDAASIQLLPPKGEESFRLAWVQATTAEESARIDQKAMVCPGFKGPDPRKLTCDELCFAPTGDGRICVGVHPRPVQTATIDVHVPRWVDTSYGCGRSSAECAFKRLRGGAPTASANPGGTDGDRTTFRREKLSLLLHGKTPYILVHAMDDRGRLASGYILVGYERWRVETGGFLAVSPLVDEELVQLVPDAEGQVTIGETTQTVGEGQVAIVKRETDRLSQETGIFVNFIPRNYETLGIGFGLATHDGGAPSIYLGPVLRLRSFGDHGLAAFTGGVLLREVQRFPDLESGVFQSDSPFLAPSTRYDYDWFFGIQLGFSFGSISVPGAGDK